MRHDRSSGHADFDRAHCIRTVVRVELLQELLFSFRTQAWVPFIVPSLSRGFHSLDQFIHPRGITHVNLLPTPARCPSGYRGLQVQPGTVSSLRQGFHQTPHLGSPQPWLQGALPLALCASRKPFAEGLQYCTGQSQQDIWLRTNRTLNSQKTYLQLWQCPLASPL